MVKIVAAPIQGYSLTDRIQFTDPYKQLQEKALQNKVFTAPGRIYDSIKSGRAYEKTQDLWSRIKDKAHSIANADHKAIGKQVLGTMLGTAKKAAMAPYHLYKMSDQEKEYVANSVAGIAQKYANEDISNHNLAGLVDHLSHRSVKLEKALKKGLVNEGVVSKQSDIRYDDQKNILGLTLYGVDSNASIKKNLLKQVTDKRAWARDRYSTGLLYSSILGGGMTAGAVGGAKALAAFTARKAAISAGFSAAGTGMNEYEIANAGTAEEVKKDSLKIGQSAAYSPVLGGVALTRTIADRVKKKWGKNSLAGLKVGSICNAVDIVGEHATTGMIGFGAIENGWLNPDLVHDIGKMIHDMDVGDFNLVTPAHAENNYGNYKKAVTTDSSNTEQNGPEIVTKKINQPVTKLDIIADSYILAKGVSNQVTKVSISCLTILKLQKLA